MKKVFALLYNFQRISGHFWPSGKGSEHGCQNRLRRVHKDTLRDFFEQKLLSLLILFGHWAKIHRPHGKIFSAFWRNFSRGLSELHSRSPGKYFERKILLNFFNAFRHWAKNFQASVKTIFGAVCQNCIVKFQSFILSKKILEGFTNVSINFGFWAKILLAFRLNVFGRDCYFCILRVHKDKLKKIVFFFQNFFFGHFLEIEKKVVRLLTVFLSMVVETALNLPMGTFRGDVCSWRNCFLNFYGK